MIEILKLSQMFSGLDDVSLEEIASTANLKHVSNDEVIFLEGGQASAIFVVGSGKVKVFKLSPEGKEQILMIAAPGDSFAEAAMFAGGRYPASAQALETCELLVIDRARFVALLGRKPGLALGLIARLSELLKQMTRLVEGLSLSDVNTRLARYLCGFRDEKTGELPGRIVLTEKKSVLASQLGTIPETLSRAFARMVRDKLISVDGPAIDILDPDGLGDLAESGH
jgi:CRP/FNR family transcriptional regulator